MKIGDTIYFRFNEHSLTVEAHVAEIYPDGLIKVYTVDVFNLHGRPANTFLIKPYTAYKFVREMFDDNTRSSNGAGETVQQESTDPKDQG